MSYGTLGFLVSVDLDIRPFKPFVRLTYTPVTGGGVEAAREVFRAACEEREGNDVIEVRHKSSELALGN